MAATGFTRESMLRVLGNLKRASTGVLNELQDGLEELQAEAVNHAKENHYARHYANTHGTVVVEPSMGGENRQWNLFYRYPRYGDTSGLLTGSIKPERLIKRSGIMLARVSAGMPYATPVEFGTTRSKPHPFMRPALRHARDVDRKDKILEKAIVRGLRKGEDRSG
jgi:hypothetical protein